MGSFSSGLLVGALVSLSLFGVVAIFAYRKWFVLERRARRAERLAELGALTGGLAHELKNPLSTVQLNLRLLEEDLSPDIPGYTRIVNRLATVQRETGRLKDTLDDFLRYGGKMELDRKPVDLNAMLQELVDFYTPQAQLKGVQVRLKPADGPVTALVDPKLIKQALLNLVLNAVQAMPTGSGELILSAAKRDAWAVIDVIDTGGGISPELLDKIFQVYYSTKPGGTGLGLAMTRRIIEEHGGRIQVTSTPGKGSDFTLFLPAAVPGADIVKK